MIRPADLKEAQNLLAVLAEINVVLAAKLPLQSHVYVGRSIQELQAETDVVHKMGGEPAVHNMLSGSFTMAIADDVLQPMIRAERSRIMNRLLNLGVDVRSAWA